MTYYYTVHNSRTQAFLLERRLKDNGIACEITYVPRNLMKDLCNMGVKFPEYELRRAIDVIRRSGLPGCKVFKEVITPSGSTFVEYPI